MYYSIKGIVAHKLDGQVVLENNGIGYCLNVSDNTSAALVLGKEAMLYCYLHVREDAFLLFGFLNEQEKELFLHLISVSGVGCKLAQTVLGSIDAYELAIAIAGSDVNRLCSIKGVGKKSAERIVLELKEKLAGKAAAAAALTGAVKKSGASPDAILALQTLGWSRQQAIDMLAATPDIEGLELSAVVGKVLKHHSSKK